MQPLIAASTITEITQGLATPEDIPLIPTPQELVAAIRARLTQQVETTKAVSGADASAHLLAKRNLDFFNDIVENPPAGFRLMPVVCKRIPPEQSAQAYAQFTGSVLPRFYHHMAVNFAEDLRRAGICEFGIARMREGLCPMTVSDRLYAFNVDHIIERAQSGWMGCEQGSDPDDDGSACRKEKETDIYPVNFFRNLLFLPEEIHEKKNRLNYIQRIDLLHPGEAGVYLMLVPDRDPLKGSPVHVPPSFRSLPTRQLSYDHFIYESAALCAKIRLIVDVKDPEHTPERTEALSKTFSLLAGRLAQVAASIFDGGKTRKRDIHLREFFNGKSAATARGIARKHTDLPDARKVQSAFDKIKHALRKKKKIRRRGNKPLKDTTHRGKPLAHAQDPNHTLSGRGRGPRR